jgi:hypothetical protein
VSSLIKFGPHFPGEIFHVLKEKDEKQYGGYRMQPFEDAAESSFQFSTLFQHLLEYSPTTPFYLTQKVIFLILIPVL